MKKIFTYSFIALAALVVSVSCTRRELVEDGDLGEGFFLTVKCSESVVTKATKDGEDDYNENSINKIDYFLYTAGDNSKAIIHGTEVNDKTVKNKQTITVYTNDGDISELFPTSTPCEAFVIVNYPEDISDIEDTSLENLQSMVFSTTWDNDGAFKVPDEFVMSGYTKNVKLKSRTKTLAAEGTVDVERIASKIQMQVTVAESVEVTSSTISSTDYTYTVETWEPMVSADNLAGLKTYMVNAVYDGMVSGDAIDSPTVFKYGQRSATGTTSGTWRAYTTDSEGTSSYTDKDVTYYTFDYYYTYPNEWKYGDADEPYFKIICPWTRTATVTRKWHRDNEDAEWVELESDNTNKTVQKQFYYKLSTPSLKFENNNWYLYQVNLAILGSDLDEAAVKVDYNYYVCDWSEEDLKFSTYMLDARYLSVEQDTIYLYNENTAEITYKTSHPCEIVGEDGTSTIYHSYLYLKDVSITRKNEATSSRYTISLPSDSLITYTKELDNTITSSNFDYTVDTIRFTIRHQDEHNYSQNVVIIQYPAIYVNGAESNGKVYVNGQGGGTDNSSLGLSVKNNNGDEMGTVVYAQTVKTNSTSSDEELRQNNNVNQYNIYVSVLPSNSTSVIGDPRQGYTAVDNLGYATYTISTDWWGRETVSTTTDDTVSDKYKPAGDDVDNVIAPAFKIASSYGKTTQMTYERAKERCASYQENGYPAGRWRLPTVAEIDFVISLSENGKIPTLFGSGWDKDYSRWKGYWAAGANSYCGTEYKQGHGVPYIDLSTVSVENDGISYMVSNEKYQVWTRCVYDIWYWGEEPVSTNATTWLGFYMD